MQKIGYILLSICFLTLVGCKKGNGEFVLKGQITDHTFNQPLSGASVKLYQVPVGSSQQVLIGSTSVSSTGEYSFSFKRDKMEKYIIKVSKNLYFDLEETVYFSSLTLEEDNVRNYSTNAKSWAKIHLFNQNPSANDLLMYTKQEGKTGCAECCGSEQQFFNGTIDTVFYCINDGNTMYSFFYSLSGTATSDIIGAVTTAFDTTEIYLQY